MKKIFVTGNFTVTLTREIMVEDDFAPNEANLNSLYYKDRTYGDLTREEAAYAIANLQLDEVWRVKDEKGNNLFIC